MVQRKNVLHKYSIPRRRYNFKRVGDNKNMSSKKKTKLIEEVFETCASANECTGLFQRINLDPEEIALFHKMYNEIDGKNSIE